MFRRALSLLAALTLGLDATAVSQVNIIFNTPAAAQTNFPQVMPADTVYGSQFVAGPGQAIPFSVLSQRTLSSPIGGTTSQLGNVLYGEGNGLAVWANPFSPVIGQTQNGINSFNGTMASGGTQTQALFYSGSTGVGQGFSIGTATIGLNAINGGVNFNNGPKTNYSAVFTNMVAQTQGQVSALQSSTLHFSNGDSSILDGIVYSYGNTAASGDEGTEGLVLGILQGPVVFTATVSGIVGNAVSYSSPTNEFSRGEARPLINTTPAKVYSTGTVTAVSGNPSVVTGSGTAWGTTFGTGSFTNLWLAIDSQTNGALMLVIPIASISSDTSLTLGYTAEGVSSGIPAPTLPSTYKIFKGSTVSSIDAVTVGGQTIPVLGHVNMNAVTDYVVGDTVQQPLGYALGLLGARIGVSPQLPCASNIGCYGINVSNLGASPLTAFGTFSGTVKNGLIFQGTNSGHVVNVANNPTNGALVASQDFTASITTRLLGVPTSVGGNTFLSYENVADTWSTAKPIRVPLTNVSGLSAFPCNSTSKGARMAVTDANAPTFLGTLTGSSTTFTPVICDGSVWRAG